MKDIKGDDMTQYEEVVQERIGLLTRQNEALIENALRYYKTPNPNKDRFDMAMHAMNSQRDALACADGLWKEYSARISELESALESAAMIAVRKTHSANLYNCNEDMALQALREVAEEIRAYLKGKTT
jgi:hemoglobin-like flavoprotein